MRSKELAQEEDKSGLEKRMRSGMRKKSRLRKEHTLNIPLPQYSGDSMYLDIFDTIVLPQVQDFVPECTLVSAGYL